MKYYCIFNGKELLAVTSCKEEAERIFSIFRNKPFVNYPEIIEVEDAKGMKPLYTIFFNSSLELTDTSSHGISGSYLEIERIIKTKRNNYRCDVRAESLEKAISLAKKRVRAFVIKENAELLEERDSDGGKNG